jgi:hypothetical protein
MIFTKLGMNIMPLEAILSRKVNEYNIFSMCIFFTTTVAATTTATTVTTVMNM